MKKLIQTRLHNPPDSVGNCYAAVIASIMDLDSPEDAIQIQEYYNLDNWTSILLNWLSEREYDLYSINGHQYDDSYYLVIGKSPRGVDHICIYQNGKLFHDPHPSQSGIITEDYFEVIIKI